MKKILCLFFILLGLQTFAAYEESEYDPYYKKSDDRSLEHLYSAVYEEQPSSIGIGINVGSMGGINVIYRNLVVNVSWDTLPLVGDLEPEVSFDFILRNSLDSVILPLYYGAGIVLKSEGDQRFGIRGVLGIGKFLNNIDENLEIFGEVNPTIYLSSEGETLKFKFGVGARYYF